MKKKFDYLRFVASFTEVHDASYKTARLFVRTLYGKVEDEINDFIFLDTVFKFNVFNPATFESRCFSLPSSWLVLETPALKAKINSYTYEELEGFGC